MSAKPPDTAQLSVEPAGGKGYILYRCGIIQGGYTAEMVPALGLEE